MDPNLNNNHSDIILSEKKPFSQRFKKGQSNGWQYPLFF